MSWEGSPSILRGPYTFRDERSPLQRTDNILQCLSTIGDMVCYLLDLFAILCPSAVLSTREQAKS